MNCHGEEHRRQNLQAHFYGIAGIKNALFVLLHILVVGKRKTFQDRKQPDQITVDTPCLSPDQLCHVRIALLGHNRGSGGICVRDGNKLEFPACPEDQFLGKPREVHHQHGKRTQKFHRKVPVGNAVNAVERDTVEPQQLSFHIPVSLIRSPGQRTAPDRRDVDSLSAVGNPVQISLQHHGIGHHIVAEAHRLRTLQVCIARHDGFLVLFR